MKTSSVYHQQKHTKTNKNYKWIYIYITNKNHSYWTYLHQLSDLAHWGTTSIPTSSGALTFFCRTSLDLTHSPTALIGTLVDIEMARA